MAGGLEAAPRRCSSVATFATELCAGNAIVAVSLVAAIGGFFCQKQHEKERQRKRLQDTAAKRKCEELRADAENEQRTMHLAGLQEQLAEVQRSSESQRATLISDFEGRLRKASEEVFECRRQLAELRISLDAMGVPIIIVDRSGLVTFWNQKAAEVCRCPAKSAMNSRLTEFLGSGDTTAFSPASIVSSMSAPGGLLATSHCQRTVCVRARRSGETWQELILHISPQRSDAGRIEGLFCIGQDVSKLHAERKQGKLAVKDLTDFISTMNAPILGVDCNGNVNEWNRKAEVLTGFSKDEAMGKNFVSHFIIQEWADAVRWMISEGLRGEDITNNEFSFFTKGGQRLDIIMSTSARRSRDGSVVGVIGVGKDITDLRSESKMHANYVRICGAAVWRLRGRVHDGSVTECNTKEIEHLISQQAQMDICDPRMVLWRASFVSILKTMCQNFWVRRKSLDEKSGGSERVADSASSPTSLPQVEQKISSWTQCSSSISSSLLTEFVYEFCFEAQNGSVKWYKVEGHLIEESLIEGKFEVTGSMQEVTSMWIDKVMGDRWMKWWSRMCHMVFDATLLVDTQEYRVLNAWGEENVFGCKLQSQQPLLEIIKAEDSVLLKEAFNEVTFKGFERGRTLHFLRSDAPDSQKEMPAQCFLLAADQENPNECMMGIRMQASEKREGDEYAVLWDVAKPNAVLTLEDLARLKSGLKRHRRPYRPKIGAATSSRHRARSGGHNTASLCSIPEDLHGEHSEDDQEDDVSASGASVKSDTESLKSSSKSSWGSESEDMSEANSKAAGINSPPRSVSEAEIQRRVGTGLTEAQMQRHRAHRPQKKELMFGERRKPSIRQGPPLVKLKTAQGFLELNLNNFPTVGTLRAQIQAVTGIPSNRQTLILNGRRLPLGEEEEEGDENEWENIKGGVKAGQILMLIGSVPKMKKSEVFEDPPVASSGAGKPEELSCEIEDAAESAEKKEEPCESAEYTSEDANNAGDEAS